MKGLTLPLAIILVRLERYAKRMAAGVGLLLISGVFAAAGVLGGILSLFFALADYSTLIYPALIAGGISLLLGVVVALEGYRFLRR